MLAAASVPGYTMGNQSDPAAAPLAGPMPMLASACPGWVCYAEKTHGWASPFHTLVS